MVENKEIIKTKIFKINNMWHIDFNELNWQLCDYGIGCDDRTFAFILHKMDYIKLLIDLDENNDNVKITKEFIFEFLKPWWNTFKNDLLHSQAWHDHATAWRAINLIYLYKYLKNTDKENSKFVEIILTEHKNKLLDESFYSKLTNHGLDQSLALYQLAHLLKDLNAKNIAIQRINNEIRHAFCEDGGHKENSPGYLNYGLIQIFNVLNIAKDIDGVKSKITFPQDILQKAILALCFFIKPNKTMPLIGDTQLFVARDIIDNNYKDNKFYLNFLYSLSAGNKGMQPDSLDLFLPISGYSIFRETWEKNHFNNSMHIVFKSGYLSQYHRHDDDLNITIFYDNEDWLIDTGLYKHMEKDPYRKYFRSSDAHNVTRPIKSIVCRDIEKIYEYGNSKLYDYFSDGNISKVKGISYIHQGYENKRELIYNRQINSLLIHDICTPLNYDNSNEYITRFHIPNDKKIFVDNKENRVNIVGKHYTMSIEAKNFVGNIKIVTGQDRPKPLGYVSYKNGILEKCYTIEFVYTNHNIKLDQEFDIKFTKEVFIEINSLIENGILKASINTHIKSEDYQYAFYLLENKEKVEQRWYEKDNSVEFKTLLKQDKTYHIVGYIRDRHKNNIARKSQIVNLKTTNINNSNLYKRDMKGESEGGADI